MPILTLTYQLHGANVVTRVSTLDGDVTLRDYAGDSVLFPMHGHSNTVPSLLTLHVNSIEEPAHAIGEVQEEEDEVPPASTTTIVNMGHFSRPEDTTCAICHETRGGGTWGIVPCDHAFHRKCILSWFKRHSTCPVCRAVFDTNDDLYNTRHAGHIVKAVCQRRRMPPRQTKSVAMSAITDMLSYDNV
jgi:hypothetical protein